MENPPTEIRYSCSPESDSTRAGDRVAIYHRISRSAITLNPTGAVLWQFMQVPRTTVELVEKLLLTYPALAQPAAQQDVDVFLGQLREHNLLSES